MRPHAFVVALAVLGIAAVAFVTTRAERRPGAARPEGEHLSSSEPAGLDDVRADRVDEPAERARTPAVGEATATLVVRVVDLDEGSRGAPVFGERVQARRAGRTLAPIPVDGSAGALGEMPRTDADGEATFRLPPGEYVVANARRDAEVKVTLEDDEERVVTLELSAMTRALAIRVVRADNGAPLEGVRAEWRGSKHVATSDADGRLLARVWRSGGDRGELTRAGFVAEEIVAGPLPSTEELRVAMRPAAGLTGHVRSLTRRPRAGVVLTVRADVPRVRTGTIDDGEATTGERVWSARTAKDGSYGLTGLIAGVPLKIEVRGLTDVGPLRREVVLAPFEERVLDFELGGGARVHGRLLTHDLRPHVQAAVRLIPADRGAEGPERFEDRGSGRELSITDADGAYSFRGVHAGTWRVVPQARSLAAERELRIGEREGEIEVDLIGAEPFFVSGTCLGTDGAPLTRLPLWGRAESGLALRALTGEDGSFRLGPFAAGEVEMHVEEGVLSQLYALVEPVVARAGAEGVVVRLKELEGGDADAARRALRR